VRRKKITAVEMLKDAARCQMPLDAVTCCQMLSQMPLDAVEML